MKDNILLNADDLYKKSQIFYEDTVHNINLAKTRPKLEDAALDVACFDVQQVIELMLKTILAKNQISFDKKEGHDIKYLLDLVTKNTDLASSKTEELNTIAHTLTDWEEKGRYSSGIKIKVDTIYRVLNIYKDIDQSYLCYRYGSNAIDNIRELFRTDIKAHINNKQAEQIMNALNERNKDDIIADLAAVYEMETADSNLNGLREHITTLFTNKIPDIANILNQLEEETKQRLGDD